MLEDNDEVQGEVFDRCAYTGCSYDLLFISSLSGLPRDHPESYHYYMWNNFFKHIDIDPANAHVLDGNAKDLHAECNSYEKLIQEAGGVHLFIGGECSFMF